MVKSMLKSIKFHFKLRFDRMFFHASFPNSINLEGGGGGWQTQLSELPVCLLAFNAY